MAGVLLTQATAMRRWDVTIRTVLLGVLVGLGLAASASAQDKVAQGMKVYGEQKCALCHSIADKGNKKGPLDGIGKKPEADLRA